MDNSSFSPVSPASSGDRGEILTPGQRGGGDPPPSSTPPPVPTPSEGHPPSEDTVLNIELAKSRLGELLRTLERKDTKVKAKGSRPPSAAPSSMPQSSGSAPAAAAAATPSTSSHHMQGNHHGTVPPHPYSAGMFPPPSPQPWAAGGAYGGMQGPPRYPNPYTMHQQQHYQMPQQPIVPPWFFNQWTMLPDQRFGVPQPAMDQNCFFCSTPAWLVQHIR